MFVLPDGVKEQVLAVLDAEFGKRKRPVPGAVLKAAILRHFEAQGSSFNEKELGFNGFVPFLEACGAVVERVPGSDVLVLPPTKEFGTIISQDVQKPASELKVRPDFWFAFLSFGGATRPAYDPQKDAVSGANVAGSDAVEIASVTAEEQLRWRREFAARLAEGNVKTSLETSLDSAAPFHTFAQILKANPEISKAWRAFQLAKVKPIIKRWADQHGIPESRWLRYKPASARAQSDRADLYAILDTVPLEELLDLRIPLRWVLRAKKG